MLHDANPAAAHLLYCALGNRIARSWPLVLRDERRHS
jgi:hypothetical protein